ncbi:MAG: helD [Bacilli bacterium]|nr:helD [Bacilli bacterium]
MKIEGIEQQLEETRLDFVVSRIEDKLHVLAEDVGLITENVIELRKHFWDDVTVNFSHQDDVLETKASIQQQSNLLAERERNQKSKQKLLMNYRRLQQSPYFARIDFSENNMNTTDSLYIGIVSFLDEATLDYLVYDWRAPISSLFYDHSPGPAAYTAPEGQVSGVLHLKRQFVIRNGEMISMFDTGEAIGDEILKQVLGKTADVQMRSIVATIQKDQNKLIRDDRSRVLLVQGAAGSGKTSAALQRIAYLLYKHRNWLTSDQMLLFSPNPLFNSYISTVLPELGEANMQQTTFQEYLDYRLSSNLQVEDAYSQLEYILTSYNIQGYASRMKGIHYKASLAFFRVIENYKQFLELQGMFFEDFLFRNRVLISKEQIAKQFYSADLSMKLTNRLESLQKWLAQLIVQLEKEEVNQPWVEDEIELLDKDDYQQAHIDLRHKNKDDESFDDFAQEKHLLGRRVVREHFRSLRTKVKLLQFIDYTAIYKQLFTEQELFSLVSNGAEQPEDWEGVCVQTIERLNKSEIPYEDASPLLFLKELIEGFHSYTAVKYVMIDEAQDYSVFQYQFIKRLFPGSKLTILGDWNQAIMAHSSLQMDDLMHTGIFDAEEIRHIHFSRSYRSTRNIVEFTRGMLRTGDQIIPFDRIGSIPQVVFADSMSALHAKLVFDIKEFHRNAVTSIAVICKTVEESNQAYAYLRNELEVNIVTKESRTYESGVLIIPAYLSKGVEFDAVLIYNGSQEQYGREQERKLFYTACTRAMHHLHIYYAGVLTPFVADLKADTYMTQ